MSSRPTLEELLQMAEEMDSLEGQQEALNEREKTIRSCLYHQELKLCDTRLRHNLESENKTLHEQLQDFREILISVLSSFEYNIRDTLPLSKWERLQFNAKFLVSKFDDLAMKATDPLHSKSRRSEHAQKMNDNKREQWDRYREIYKKLRRDGKGIGEAQSWMQNYIRNETGKKPPTVKTLREHGLKG